MNKPVYPYNVEFPTPEKPWPLIGGGFNGPPKWRGGKPVGGIPYLKDKFGQDDYDGTLELVIEVSKCLPLTE